MDIAYIRQNITPLAPGVPLSVIDTTVSGVISDFFIRSEAWQVSLDPIMVVKNLSYYDMTNPEYTRVIKVLKAEYNGLPLTAIDEVSMRALLTKKKTGTPTEYALTPDAQMLINPLPTVTGGNIVVRGVLTTKGQVTYIDDYIAYPHLQAFIDGTLAKIFAMPQGWNDQKTALMHKQLYEAAIITAKRANNQQPVNIIRRVKYGGL